MLTSASTEAGESPTVCHQHGPAWCCQLGQLESGERGTGPMRAESRLTVKTPGSSSGEFEEWLSGAEQIFNPMTPFLFAQLEVWISMCRTIALEDLFSHLHDQA